MKRKLNYSNGESEGIVIFYHKDKKLYPIAIGIETLDLITFMLGNSGLTIIDQPADINIYRVKTKEKENEIKKRRINMDKPKIVTGQNFLTKEYFAFREFNFTKGVGHGTTPEAAKLDLLNIEKLREVKPEEININIKIRKDKIYYGIDDIETAEYLTDEYNLQESFENFITYFLPIYNEEKVDELVSIEGLL